MPKLFSALATADFEQLVHCDGGSLWHLFEKAHRLLRTHAPDQIGYQPHLLRRLPDVSAIGPDFEIFHTASLGGCPTCACASIRRYTAVRPPSYPVRVFFSFLVCPRKVRVGANSPSRWPTMFSLT